MANKLRYRLHWASGKAPFFCHDDRYRFEGSRVMCAGHVDAMNALAATGFYNNADDAERRRRGQHAEAMVRERDRIYYASVPADAR